MKKGEDRKIASHISALFLHQHLARIYVSGHRVLGVYKAHPEILVCQKEIYKKSLKLRNFDITAVKAV